MSSLIDNFCASVLGGSFLDENEFALGFCGDDHEFSRVLSKLLSGATNDEERKKMRKSLDFINRQIADGQCPNQGQDLTISGRWLALSYIALYLLDGHTLESLDYIKEAKKHFDGTWELAMHKFPEDWKSAACSDYSEPEEEAEKCLFAKYKSVLTPWTEGSWMVWDILNQLNGTGKPSAVEVTNVLINHPDGIMKLNVELLPGPARVVTPNWLQLGMIAIATDNADTNFFGHIQRAMTLAAPKDLRFRIRWHLEATNQKLWEAVLKGSSGEAAAACVTMAAYKQLEEQADNGVTGESILDEQVAVSATVGNNVHDDLFNCPLLPVKEDTLCAKFSATQKTNIDVIGLKKGQPMNSVTKPKDLRVEFVQTVGEAFKLLRGVKLAIEQYCDYVRNQFPYYEMETPTQRG